MKLTTFIISALLVIASSEFVLAENESPVIGILCQEVFFLLEVLSPGHKCYIASSYVKWVESGGARAVPILIGENRSYYEEILGKINGVVFPGGEAPMYASGGYGDATEYIFDIAKKMNDEGTYLPIWGTCLGYETLLYQSNNRVQYRTPCFSERQPIPLEFKQDVKTSRLYGKASDDVLKKLGTLNITSNFHLFCVTEKNMAEYNLTNQWRVLTTNVDRIGTHFVSSVEHKKYPFYGIQFHPEKNIFEWVPGRRISHSTDAIIANRYYGEFFNSEVRKNYNSFKSQNELLEHLFSNYQTFFSGRYGKNIIVYQEVYFFD